MKISLWPQLLKDLSCVPGTTCCRISQLDPGHPSLAEADWHFIAHLPFYSRLFRRLLPGLRSPWPVRWSLTHEDIPMEEERPVCLPLSELVDSDDSGARPAACHGRTSRCNVCGRILLQCRARLTRCRCSIAEEIGGGCTGQMARAKQPPGESGLSASLPPFSSTSLIGGAEERLFC